LIYVEEDRQLEYDYSDKMKKLMKKPGSPFIIIVLTILLCLVAVFGIYSYVSSVEEVHAEIKNAEAFNPVISDTVNNTLSKNTSDGIVYKYSSLAPQFLSDPFATDNYDTINYCIAVDADYVPYIVAINAGDMDRYADLVEYTYSDSTDAPVPAATIMKGIPEKISDELGKTAAEALNLFYGEKVTDEDNFADVTGALFLNTTKVPAVNYSVSFVYLILFAALFIILGQNIVSQKKYRKYHQNSLDKFSGGELLAIDQELEQPSTVNFEEQKLYITAAHLISKEGGVDIIPIHDIVHVYGSISTSRFPKKQGLIAVTRDGVQHTLVSMPFQNQENSVITEISEKIRSFLPDIKYGSDTGFYTTSGSSLTAGNGMAASGNLFLGIIGAIIGAALGSVVWILIGKAGFIAGIAGFLMAVLAMKGYSLLAGSMDRKGLVISILIVLLMIFAANYTSYALEICTANNTLSLSGLIDAYQRLPGLLTAAKLWGSFSTDLAIAYFLTLLSCFSLIRNAFRHG